MRREDLYLNDIIEAADHIAAFLAGTDFEAFQKSEILRSAVVQKLSIIGEAAARLPEGLQNRYPQVPWPQIAAFRNILVHAYFGIDWGEVWPVDFVRQRSRCVRLLEETCHGTTVKPFLRNFFREAAAQDDFHAQGIVFPVWEPVHPRPIRDRPVRAKSALARLPLNADSWGWVWDAPSLSVHDGTDLGTIFTVASAVAVS